MIHYANVDGQLTEPSTGLKGICPGCDNSVTAKCGSVKIHHWAHQRRIDCDLRWEPMTQWWIFRNMLVLAKFTADHQK